MTDYIASIIDNFDKQYQLYKQMLSLSNEQLKLLEGKTGSLKSDHLHQILARRQSLMGEICDLNEQNKNLQQNACQDLDVDEFVLRSLQGKIDLIQFNQLQEMVASLGKILDTINQTDRQSQDIIHQNLGGECKVRYTSQQAQKAYNQGARKTKK